MSSLHNITKPAVLFYCDDIINVALLVKVGYKVIVLYCITSIIIL